MLNCLTFLITGKIKHSEATLYFVHVDFIVRLIHKSGSIFLFSLAISRWQWVRKGVISNSFP
jgi:hypothetical protein